MMTYYFEVVDKDYIRINVPIEGLEDSEWLSLVEGIVEEVEQEYLCTEVGQDFSFYEKNNGELVFNFRNVDFERNI